MRSDQIADWLLDGLLVVLVATLVGVLIGIFVIHPLLVLTVFVALAILGGLLPIAIGWILYKCGLIRNI